MTIATSGKKCDYRRVCVKLPAKLSDFEEIMASKVGVPPLKGQVSKNLSMLKVNWLLTLVITNIHKIIQTTQTHWDSRTSFANCFNYLNMKVYPKTSKIYSIRNFIQCSVTTACLPSQLMHNGLSCKRELLTNHVLRISVMIVGHPYWLEDNHIRWTSSSIKRRSSRPFFVFTENPLCSAVLVRMNP